MSTSRCESQRSSLVVPAQLQSSPEFFVGDVQVALRLLDTGMAEHELNDPDVDAVGKQPAGTFVPQVVPSEIDPLELSPFPPSSSTTPCSSSRATAWNRRCRRLP